MWFIRFLLWLKQQYRYKVQRVQRGWKNKLLEKFFFHESLRKASHVSKIMTAKEKKSLLVIDDVTADWRKICSSSEKYYKTDRVVVYNSDE